MSYLICEVVIYFKMIYFFVSVVPFGVNNKYVMSCFVSLWGKQTDKDSVSLEMKRAGFLLSENSGKSSGHQESSSFNGANSLMNAVKVSPHSVSLLYLFIAILFSLLSCTSDLCW